MKRLMMVFGMAGAMTAAMAAGLGQEVWVHIPFDFMVCDQRLPAGQYTIRDTGTRDTVAIHKEDQRKWATFHPLAVRKLDPAAKTLLVFDKIQGRHFLREVWVQGRQTGVLVPRGRTQREMAAESERQVMVLAAR